MHINSPKTNNLKSQFVKPVVVFLIICICISVHVQHLQQLNNIVYLAGVLSNLLPIP